jgi:hypothetical protein
MKIAAALVSFLFASPLFASNLPLANLVPSFEVQAIVAGMDWVIGDKASYNLDMGMAQGTMNMVIHSKEGENFWMHQELSLGSYGDHLIETLVDPSSGKILKIIVDGRNEDVPEATQPEIVSTSEEDVTVPAGTFHTVHVVSKDSKSGKESDTWLNDTEIPVSGIAKAIEPADFGKAKLELTGFIFAPRS